MPALGEEKRFFIETRGGGVRITAGELKGRRVAGPEGLEVRPTGAKIRQAFFNILSNKIEGSRFVDVCAGSGLMGFEALSRGAAGLIAIEENRRIAKSIQENIYSLGVAKIAEVIAGDAKRVLPVLGPREADIIFADPPYKSQLAEPILAAVEKHELLAEDGVFAIEHSNDTRLPESIGTLTLYDRRKYGQTAISFYRNQL